MPDLRIVEAAPEADAFGAPDRHSQIVEVAARLFYEKGYRGTSIQDIATQVGMLKGSLYYHITSKEDLLLAVIKKAHDEGLAKMRARLAHPHRDARARLRAMVEGHIENLTANLVPVTVFFQEFRLLRPEHRSQIVKERDEYEAIARGLLLEGQREGTICPHIDVKLAALAILGSLNWTYQWYRPDGSMSAQDVASALSGLVLRTVSCDCARH